MYLIFKIDLFMSVVHNCTKRHLMQIMQNEVICSIIVFYI